MPTSKEEIRRKYVLSEEEYGFMPGPVPPARHWRNGNYLEAFVACRAPNHKPVDPAVHARFSIEIRKFAPEDR
jgi:hypothetical protein